MADARGDVFRGLEVVEILSDTTYLLIGFRKTTPYKIVNLVFQLVIVNNKLMILWGS